MNSKRCMSVKDVDLTRPRQFNYGRKQPKNVFVMVMIKYPKTKYIILVFFDLSYMEEIPFVKCNFIGCCNEDESLRTLIAYSLDCCNNCANYWTVTVVSSFYYRIQILKNNDWYDTDD